MKCMLQLRCCMDGHGPFGQLVATTAVQSLPQHGFSVHVMLSSPEFARLGCCRLAALSKYSRWIRRSCFGCLHCALNEHTHTETEMRSAVCSRLGDPRFLWSFRFQGFGPVVSELLGIFVLKLARVRRLRYLVALSNFEASCMQGLRLGAGCLVRIPLHRPGSAKVAEGFATIRLKPSRRATATATKQCRQCLNTPFAACLDLICASPAC